MQRRAIVTVGVVAVAVAVGGAAIARNSWVSRHAASASVVAVNARREPGFTDAADRDTQIRVWNQALAADPTSALVLGHLAALHAQRAREGGTYDDYLKAEAYARRSMAKRTNRNASTSVTLVSVLLAQHRFLEARDEAVSLVQREPDIPQYRSLLGEVAMELGDYATTQTMFDSAWSERGSLATAPRLARWMELNGHIREARRMLVAARDDAMSRLDVATETKAWFNMRVGDLELRAGHLRAAEDAYRAGVAIEPDDPRLQAAMARLAASRGDQKEVILWGERAIGMQLDPGTLGLVGDAYAALGDTAKSSEYFHTLEVAVTAQPGPFHRAWSLYLLDHGLRVPEVLRKAQLELIDRKDIYGYDLMAWALHKSGRDAEAVLMMRQALKLNTPDPLLERHAAAIAKSTGQPLTLNATDRTAEN